MANLFPVWPPAPAFPRRGAFLSSKRRAAWARREVLDAFSRGTWAAVAEALAGFSPRPSPEEAWVILACLAPSNREIILNLYALTLNPKG